MCGCRSTTGGRCTARRVALGLGGAGSRKPGCRPVIYLGDTAPEHSRRLPEQASINHGAAASSSAPDRNFSSHQLLVESCFAYYYNCLILSLMGIP